MFYNKDVRYVDKTHQYFDVKSGKELESVTTALKKFQPEFEHDYWANFKATQEGVSKYRKDLEWHLLREHGTTKGSYIHDYLECATQGKYFEKPVPEFIYKPALDKCIELANQFVEWYRESKFSLVVPELIVNDNKNAGQIDNLSCVNNDLHKLAIVDYKGLALDTLIPTPEGYKQMKDIEVGDIVYDGEGKKTKVKHVSKVHYNPCYKIYFNTNDFVIADEDHKWVVINGVGRASKEIICRSVDLYTHFKNNLGRNKLKIKNHLGLETDEKILPIDPYVLGMWLGDGNSYDGKITCVRKEIWDEIKKRGYQISSNLEKRGMGAEYRTVYGLRTKLRENNLLKNKHIPDLYLRASYTQRLDLLRGYMDADGSWNKKRKRFVMSTTKLQQAEDIKSLVSTFGVSCTIVPYKASGFGKTNIQAYCVSFLSKELPFLCRNNYLDTEDEISRRDKNFASKHKYITRVETMEVVPTKCISVESASSTYLFGKGTITTHNTDKAIEFNNQYGNLLEPYTNMPDCNWSKYCLQVNKYQELFEKKFTGYNIVEKWIVWIYEENEKFKLFEVPDVEILF